MAWSLRRKGERIYSSFDSMGRVPLDEMRDFVSSEMRGRISNDVILYVVSDVAGKNRFHQWFVKGDPSSRPTHISAAQGHSMKNVKLNSLGAKVNPELVPGSACPKDKEELLNVDTVSLPPVLEHGTYLGYVSSIMKYGLVPGGI